MWLNVKRTMNWETEGAPGELRNKKSKVETKLEAVAEVFHDSLEEKVLNIVKEMEPFEETYAEEKKALENTFPRKSNEVFEFNQIEEEKVVKILKSLPAKVCKLWR